MVNYHCYTNYHYEKDRDDSIHQILFSFVVALHRTRKAHFFQIKTNTEEKKKGYISLFSVRKYHYVKVALCRGPLSILKKNKSKNEFFFLQFMIAWTWYIGVRCSGRSDLVVLMK